MKTKKQPLILLLSILLLSVLAACAGGGDAPAQTVELYHEALVAKDQDRLINFSCADWESTAFLELDSFVSVETELVGVSCETVSEEDGQARVQCEGVITATYDGEARDFPLSNRTFLVVQEGGDWRLCGYE